MEILVEIMGNKKAAPSVRVSAATAILDRAYGRPATAVELSGPDGRDLISSESLTDVEATRRVLFLVRKEFERRKAIPGELSDLDRLLEEQPLGQLTDQDGDGS